MCYRSLDTGKMEFCSERVSQKCSDSGKDDRSIEDIGPQEEGETAVVCVVYIHLELITFLIHHFISFHRCQEKNQIKKGCYRKRD